MGAILRTVERLAQIGRLLAGEARADQHVAVARQLVEPVRAHRHAEVLRRDVLELVGFVDDGVAALRDHLAVRTLAHGRVRAEQVVIHDDEVRIRGARPHAGDEAIGVAGALGADAIFRCRGDLSPEWEVFWQVRNLGAVARFGPFRPLVDDGKKDLRR